VTAFASAFALLLIQAQAGFGIEFFEQSESLLEVRDGLLDLRFEIAGEIDHRLLAFTGLSEVERVVSEIVVRGTAAIGVAAFANHLDERAVDEALGIVEEKVEAAA